MEATDNAPVIVGVGEASERLDASGYEALSPADLAGRAAKAALEDAGAGGLAGRIDVIAAIRQFEVSGPNARPPFGAADNFARAVGRRIGADPARAVLEVVGGQGPQHLVNEFAHAIAAGEAGVVLLVGSEAISTVRALTARGETRGWSEAIGGQIEDRGFGGEGLLTRDLAYAGARTPITVYALFENARRRRLGLSREAYRLEMARLFAPFTSVAEANPHAMSPRSYSAEALAEITPDNRLTADPFPRRMVARDQANQGAAVLMTSAGQARAMGIDEGKLVYLLGGADVRERTVMERADLSRGPASILACRQALEAAGLRLNEVEAFDFYSCFPIAVFNVCDGLGLAPDDPRGLTVTGGLPFFGGAGNNYSMHAIAEMVRRLRSRPGASGLVGANGGFLSKYSVGIYSAAARPWSGFSSAELQSAVDAWPAPPLASAYEGPASIETYTIDYAGAAPRGIVVARTPAGERLAASVEEPSLVRGLVDDEPLEGAVRIAPVEGRHTVTVLEPR
jgi:acetyl-CoA C-acetyltransferase